MPKPCSIDLRARVIGAVEAGASRREAAERFDLSPSAAIKWVKRYYETGSAGAKPCGGSTSPLEEHTDWLLSLIAEQPDLTLDEIVAAMRKQRIPGSRSAVWRFFERHNVSVSGRSESGGIELNRSAVERADSDSYPRGLAAGPATSCPSAFSQACSGDCSLRSFVPLTRTSA